MRATNVLMRLAPRENFELRVSWVKAALLATGWAMFALSRHLWVSHDSFPAVPFFSAAPRLGPAASQIVFAGMLFCQLLGLTGARKSAWFAVAGTVLTGVIFLDDQTRFQPWTYQYALFALALSLLSAKEAAVLLRWLTIGIYSYSGPQKLNFSFTQRIGPLLLKPVLAPLGLSPAGLSAPARIALTLAMPLAELSIGPLLFFEKSRRLGLALSVAMHLTILGVIGPLGLNCNSVVWPWNVFMIVSNILLFAPLSASSKPAKAKPEASGLRFLPYIAVSLALVFPLLRVFGLADAFPAFALYSSQIENTMFLVDPKAVERLPERLRAFLGEPVRAASGQTWLKLDHNEWILSDLNVPPYPQHRVQTGVALALCRRFGLGDGLIVDHYSPPDVWDGTMKVRRLEGCDAVAADAGRYWFNAEPSK